MKRGVNKWVRVVIIIIIIPVVLSLLIGISISFPSVQQSVINKITARYYESYQKELSVGKFYLNWKGQLKVEDIFMEDMQGDTLANISSLGLGINYGKLIHKDIVLSQLELRGATIKIYTTLHSDLSNFAFLLPKDEKQEVPQEKRGMQPSVDIKRVEIANSTFMYHDSSGGLFLSLEIGTFSSSPEEIIFEEKALGLGELKIGNTHFKLRIGEDHPDSESEPFNWDISARQLQLTSSSFLLVNNQTHMLLDARVGNLSSRAEKLYLPGKEIKLKDFTLEDSFYKQVYELGHTNQPEEDTASKAPFYEQLNWDIEAGDLRIRNSSCFLIDRNQDPDPNSFDMNNLMLSDMQLHLSGHLKKNFLTADLKGLSLKDGDKLSLDRLSGGIDIDFEEDHMIISDLKLETPQTAIRADVVLKGMDFSAPQFSDMLEVELRKTSIDPVDLNYIPIQNFHFSPPGSHKISLKTQIHKNQNNIDFRLSSSYPGNYRVSLIGSGRLEDQKLVEAQITLKESEIISSFLKMLLPDLEEEERIDDAFTVKVAAKLQLKEDSQTGDLSLESKAGAIRLNFHSDGQKYFVDYTLSGVNTYPLTGDSLFSSQRIIGTAQINMKDGKIGFFDGDILCRDVQSKFLNTDTLDITLKGDLDQFYFDVKSQQKASLFETEGHLVLQDEGIDLEGSMRLGTFSPKDYFNVSFSTPLTGEAVYSLHKSKDTIDLRLGLKDLYAGTIQEPLFDELILEGALHPFKTLLAVSSDSLELNFTADTDVSDFFSSLPYYESLITGTKNEDSNATSPHAFTLDLNLSGYNEMIALFVPQLKLDGQMNLTCQYQDSSEQFNLHFDSPGIAYQGLRMGPMVLEGHKKEERGNLHLQMYEFSAGKVEIPGISLNVNQISTEFLTELQLLNSDTVPILDMPLRFEVDSNLYGINLSDPVSINQKEYDIVSNDTLLFNKSGFIKGDLEIGTDDHIIIARVDANHHLEFRLEKSSLTHIEQLFIPDLYLEGSYALSLISDLKQVDITLDFAELSVDSLAGITGSVELTSADLENFDLSVKMDGDLLDSLRLDGHYSTKNDLLSASIALGALNFDSINSLMTSLPVGLTGKMGLQLELAGNSKHPEISGNLALQNSSVSLKSTATSYRIGDKQFKIEKNRFIFDKLLVSDQGSGELTVDGEIGLEGRSPVYDIHLVSDRFEVLNNSWHAGSRVYGQLFVTTDLTITGDTLGQNISGSAGISEGTELTLSKHKSLKESHFDGIVNFISDKDQDPGVAGTKQGAGMANMTVDVDLSIDPHSNIKYVFNQISNEFFLLEGTGAFKLVKEMGKDPYFTGDFVIEDGKMLINPPIVPRKNLILQEGGQITWTGDIRNPSIALKGYNEVRADAQELLDDDQSRFVSFKVYIDLIGMAEDLQISFSLDTEDPEVQNIILQLPEDEQSRMATNLLLFSSLTTKKDKNPVLITSSVAHINQFVTGQLNNLFRDDVQFLDLDFSSDTYSGYHDVNSKYLMSVYHYSVSKRFLHNQLQIKVGGHLDAQKNFHAQSDIHNVIGDLELEYAIDKNGNLLLKVFNNTNYEGILIDEVTKTGVSIKLNRDINSFQQLFNLKED